MGSTRILEETNSIKSATMCCRVDGSLGREDTISGLKTQHCDIPEGTLQSLGRVLWGQQNSAMRYGISFTRCAQFQNIQIAGTYVDGTYVFRGAEIPQNIHSRQS